MTRKQLLFSVIVGVMGFAILSPRALAQDADLAFKINEAIDKGVEYVKKYQKERGNAAAVNGAAPWALRGWALLETGIPANDETVKKIAEYVRRQVPEIHEVYDLSLALIFLDKLADQGDEPLIESIAVRLLAGQGDKGGWTYTVDMPHKEEKVRLANLVQDMEKLRSQGLVIKLRPRTPQEITQDMVRQLNTIKIVAPNFGGDNSNTQFAMIAVWVARRHGLPVDKCLAFVGKRFQVSQLESGAWSYDFPNKVPALDDNRYTYPAMTCAGLLGLALGQGIQANPKDLSKNIQVQRGFEVLAKAIAEPPPVKRHNLLYFLFSMERAAVVYNLKKIGPHDWYLWGAEKLVKTQKKDGSWDAGFGDDAADTCLALLFLKRANVAKDLTEILEAPIRKGPGNKKSGPPKAPDKTSDPSKAAPKSDGDMSQGQDLYRPLCCLPRPPILNALDDIIKNGRQKDAEEGNAQHAAENRGA